MKFSIIGAGMAGLLAAALLRDECEMIFEKQDHLPNNHNALLRFKSSIVGDSVNIPFERVSVIKTTDIGQNNPVAEAIAYSRKTTGAIAMRSILTADGEMQERFIAPPDFIARLKDKVSCPIRLGVSIQPPFIRSDNPTISTMPMPVLMHLLGYPTIPEFKSVEGCSLTADLKDCNICASVYVTDLLERAYRVSITKNKFIAEYAFPGSGCDLFIQRLTNNSYIEASHLLKTMFAISESSIDGKPRVKKQSYAKILPIDENQRRRFILWATENYNVYSLGRFATWRPGLLLDDIVNDVRVIRQLANGGTSYKERIYA